MKIPKAAAAQRQLARLYHNTATVTRIQADAQANRMVTETVYSAIQCHLSARRGLGAQRGAALKQTAAQAQVVAGYTVYFPAGTDIRPGDRIDITSKGRTVSGHAGHTGDGELSVAVALDAATVA